MPVFIFWGVYFILVSNIFVKVSKIIHWYLNYFNLLSVQKDTFCIGIKSKKSKLKNILLDIKVTRGNSVKLIFKVDYKINKA